MEPISLFSIYATGFIVGGIGIGYYIENYSYLLYERLEQYIEDNFVFKRE